MEWTNQIEVQKWLAGKSPETKRKYIIMFKVFHEFTGMTPNELIDEAEIDREKSKRHQGMPELRLNGFYDWLLNEYKQTKKSRSREKTDRVGVSKKYASACFEAIRGFYKANGFPLDVRSKRAVPKKSNQKLVIRPLQVKKLLDACKSLRDKAIILCMFQGGMDVSTLCSLDYGDVSRELEEEKVPLMLHVVREKEQVEYITFLGKDATEALKLYLNERRKRYKEKLRPNTPLFVKEGRKTKKSERMTPRLIQKMTREIAVLSGLVSEDELEVSDINPARPHALRAAFSSILSNQGVNQFIIEYMLGHKLQYDAAYLIPHPDELRKIYEENEHGLAIGLGVVGEAALEDMKNKLLERDEQIKELEERVKKFEDEFEMIELVMKDPKMIDDFKKFVELSELINKKPKLLDQLKSLAE